MNYKWVNEHIQIGTSVSVFSGNFYYNKIRLRITLAKYDNNLISVWLGCSSIFISLKLANSFLAKKVTLNIFGM